MPPMKKRKLRYLVSTVFAASVLAWAGSVACYVLVGNGQSWALVLNNGSLSAVVRVGPSRAKWDYPKFRAHLVPFAFGPASPHIEAFPLLGMMYVRIPLWYGVLGSTAAMLYAVRRRTRSAVNCVCGYDLTGNVSGRCPECGSPCGTKDGERS